jgi:hypothetical protein
MRRGWPNGVANASPAAGGRECSELSPQKFVADPRWQHCIFRGAAEQLGSVSKCVLHGPDGESGTTRPFSNKRLGGRSRVSGLGLTARNGCSDEGL